MTQSTFAAGVLPSLGPEAETICGEAVAGEANFERRRGGKLLSPERRRGAVRHVREAYRISERNACRLLGQSRGTQRYEVQLKQLQEENTRLKQVVADLTLDKAMLQDVLSKKF